MSDHTSNGTHEEDMCDSNPKEIIQDSNEIQTLKSEVKLPIQANFGRPRKHPYKPGKYKCDYCEVMCSKPSVLKKHLRAHTNERPYPCSSCKRSFKTKSNLSKHMKSKSHSSKIPSNKEKASLMLQALSGLGSEPLKLNVGSTSKIEYDCVEKGTPVENSPTTSCEDRSVASEDNSVEDFGQKDNLTDHSQEKVENGPDIELSSCSGTLTINSQAGPITVEVEIKLETMKQLQHGMSNIAMKRASPSSPSSSIMRRNDADVRAAESILHMANQRDLDVCPPVMEDRSAPIYFEPKLIAPKEELRRIELKESPESVIPVTTGSQVLLHFSSKPVKSSPLSYNPKNMSRSRAANKSIPNEDQKKVKKCLMESLLKKMQKKNEKSSRQEEQGNNNGTSLSCTNFSVTESHLESIPQNHISVTQTIVPQKNMLSINSTPIPYKLKALISDSKPSSLIAFNPSIGKPTMVLQKTMSPNSLAVNCPTSLSSSSTILVLSSYSDDIQIPQRIHSPISVSNFKVDTATDVLSKVFKNTNSLYQHHGCNVTTQNVVPIASCQVKSSLLPNIKEESIIQNKNGLESPEHTVSTDDSETTSYNQHPSNFTTVESDSGSSPRLCIVEDSTNIETIPENKKCADSDEEIDVVNTDSDDNDSTIKKMSGRSGSIYNNKKRKGNNECDADLMESESKKQKEMEKIVTLHAPNINAEDLVQDCPLNLSANRHPIIPSCSQSPQMSGSVLENIYRPMVTSGNSSNTESNIEGLTNNNPAHPLSNLDAPLLDMVIPSNGHPLDYPIFEDKVRCDVCSQMIEPSKLHLHKNMHIYTDGKDQQSPGNNISKFGIEAAASKQAFNKPRTYRCVVCNIGFRVMGHLSKHHKSKSHLQGLVNSGLLSKTLNAKIEESKVPIAEVIDQKTGNIIPDVLSRYLSDWSQPTTDCDST